MSKQIQPRNLADTPSGISAGILFMLKTVAIAYGVSILLLLPTALIATLAAFSDRGVSVSVNIVTAIAVLFCGFSAGRHFSSKGLVFGAICGIIYSALLCIIGCLISKTPDFGSCAATALTIGLICGSVGGIVGINTKRKRHR